MVMVNFALPWTLVTTVVCARVKYGNYRPFVHGSGRIAWCITRHRKSWFLTTIQRAWVKILSSYPQHCLISCFSLAAKGNFAKKNGLEGVTMWTVAGDYDDLLIDSVRKGLKI